MYWVFAINRRGFLNSFLFCYLKSATEYLCEASTNRKRHNINFKDERVICPFVWLLGISFLLPRRHTNFDWSNLLLGIVVTPTSARSYDIWM